MEILFVYSSFVREYESAEVIVALSLVWNYSW